MKQYTLEKKIIKNYELERQSGEILNVKNIHQAAAALNATYCFVWKKLKQLDDPDIAWVTVKNCIIRKRTIVQEHFKKDKENEQKSV